jgi:hypothetical protein
MVLVSFKTRCTRCRVMPSSRPISANDSPAARYSAIYCRRRPELIRGTHPLPGWPLFSTSSGGSATVPSPARWRANLFRHAVLTFLLTFPTQPLQYEHPCQRTAAPPCAR